MSAPHNPNSAYPPSNVQYPPVNAAYPPPVQGFTNQGYGVPPPPAYTEAVNEQYNKQDAPQQNAGFNPGMPMPLPKMPAQNSNVSYNENVDSTAGSFSSFTDKAVRRGFIKKVYLILMTQLLVTFTFVAVFFLVDPIKRWVQGPGSWFYYVSYGTFFVTYFVLVCCPSVRRKYPGNFICLAVFTLAFSYMVGTISSFYDHESILMAVGITAAVCLAISLFAIQTKIDFTMCSGLLFVLCMVVFLFGLLTMVMGFAIGWQNIRILNIVYSCLAALLFGMFLIYDTQMIVGGRKHELSPEEYIYGALQLYIDIVYLFLIILSLFGSKN